MTSSFSARPLFLKGGMLLFLCLLLLFPAAALSGAKKGLLLWFYQVLPSLLPFLILSTLFLSTGLSDSLARRLSPFLSPIFKCSPSGCYAIVIGLLAGLPVGAKTIASLVERGQITKKEGQYLLPLCNNPSPLFLLGFISVSVLKTPSVRYPLLFIVTLSSMLAAALFRPKAAGAPPVGQNNRKHPVKKFSFSFLLLDSAIEQAFLVLTRVGGYIILFSVLAEFLTKMPLPPLLLACIGSFLEITTGCTALAALPLPKTVLFPLIAAFVTFGGLSTAAQTKSVLAGSGLPIAHYLLTKAAPA
ncbi:MAG: nucleoside recognition domain-containing protein, partial [Lachnospiraceae bacterium]